MPKQLFLGANWKMNAAPEQLSIYKSENAPTVVVFPSFLDLKNCIDAGLSVGAQCGRSETSGAFTGNVSMVMLKGFGCSYVLCGHSERRRHHGENDEQVAKQAEAALKTGLVPIVCIGETMDEREEGMTEEVLKRQLSSLEKVFNKASEGVGLAGPAPGGHNLGKGEPARGTPLGGPFALIAYEPIWAISNGNGNSEAMGASEAQKMHAFIRSIRPKTPILYGGSMNAKNAKELLSQPDIDGGLIGQASLNPSEFGKIVEIAKSL